MRTTTTTQGLRGRLNARGTRTRDVLHPESKQQTTPAAPRDALECDAALARTREDRQNCVRFAYL